MTWAAKLVSPRTLVYGTTEYLVVEVTAEETLTAQPVAISVDRGITWHTAAWKGDEGTVRAAQVLATPAVLGGGFVNRPVLVRITHDPELPWLHAGTLTVIGPAAASVEAETLGVAAHEAAPDPHPQYAAAGDITAAVAAHAADEDPHAAYVTGEEVTTIAAAEVAAHEGEANARRLDLVSKLQAPFFIAHRGGNARYGEHSMEGYRASSQSMFPIEQDLQRLADAATYAPSHDGTVDRTMAGGTGNVSSFTPAQWRDLRIKGVDVASPTAAASTWDDILNEFGGRIVLFPEIKSGDPQQVIDSIVARGLQRAVVVQSFTQSVCAQVAAAGIPAMLLTGGTAPDFAAVKAQGIDYVGPDTTASSTYVANAVAAGLTVVMHVINDPGTVATRIGQGVSGFFCADPWAASMRYATRSTDPFRELIPWPRMLKRGNPPLVFAPPNEYGRLDTATSGTVAVEMGWAGRRGNCRIEATLRYTGPTTGEDRWAGIAYGRFSSEAETYTDGANATQVAYSAYLRRNGQLVINRMDTAITGLGSFSGTAVAAAGAAGTVRVRLDVTAAGVTFTNLTTNQSVTSSDVVVPRTNGRIALTFSTVAVLASEVTVTDL